MPKKLLILLIPLVFLCSCKKDSDTEFPEISITDPYENQVFSVSDTIGVVASVSDNKNLDYVSVRIVNNEMAAVSAVRTFEPGDKTMNIALDMVVEDQLIPSGDYYIHITASDGENVTNEYKKINIHELEKRLRFVLVLTKNGADIAVNKIDSLGHVTQVKVLTSDYCGSAVSSDLQQFYIAGRYTGDVSVFNVNNWQLQWSVPVIVSTPFPYFEYLDVHNNRLYVSYREGLFKIFNETGGITALRVIENGEYPLEFLPVNDYLLTYEVSPDGMQRHVVAYFLPSFTIFRKIPVTYDVLKIFPCNNDECLLFCNNSGVGNVKMFSFLSGDISSRYTFNDGEFAGITAMSPVQYLVSSGNNIWNFGYDYKGFISWSAAQLPGSLVYDGTEECYYYSENYLSVVKKHFLPLQTVATYNFQDTVINILPVYNRD